MNCTLLLVGTPPTDMARLPLTAVGGTVAVILVSFQVVTVALALPLEALNCSVLVPCVAPNPLPLRWTMVPTGPLEGVIPEISGFGSVKTWF